MDIYANTIDVNGNNLSNTQKSLMKGKCIFPFIYNGVEYNECINNPKFGKWCATKVNVHNKPTKMGFCKRSKKKLLIVNRTQKHNPNLNQTVPQNRNSPSINNSLQVSPKQHFYETDIYRQLDLRKKSFDLVIGNVQSGKTKILLGQSYKAIEQGMLSIIIVRVSLADAAQISNRIQKDFNKDIPNKDYRLTPILVDEIHKFFKVSDKQSKKQIEKIINKEITILINPQIEIYEKHLKETSNVDPKQFKKLLEKKKIELKKSPDVIREIEKLKKKIINDDKLRLNKIKEGISLFRRKYNTLIAIAHPTQLGKCKSFLEDILEINSSLNFCLCIDEVDLVSGKTSIGAQLMIDIQLLPNIYYTLGVTATPMATILSMGDKIHKPELIVNRVFKLLPSSKYLGVSNMISENDYESGMKRKIIHHPVESVENYLESNVDDPEEESVKEQDIIHRIMTNCQSTNKFCIALILSTIENKKQDQLLCNIINNPINNDFFKNGWVGLVYNQSGGIRIVSKIPGISTIVRDNALIFDSKNKYLGIDVSKLDEELHFINNYCDNYNTPLPHKKSGRPPKTDIITIKTNSGIHKLQEKDISRPPLGALPASLQYLKYMGVTKILIISGKKAARGISFVDEDYTELNKSPYHLTDLYIRNEIEEKKRGGKKYKGKHCEALIQSLRILGVYTKYKRNLHLWSTTELYEEINKCYSQIQIYQDKLSEETRQRELLPSPKAFNYDNWKKIVEPIEQSVEDAPSTITRPRIQRDMLKTSSIKEKMKLSKTLSKTVGITYDTKTKGWCLINESDDKRSKNFLNTIVGDNPCNYLNCDNVLDQVDQILLKLQQIYPNKQILDKPKHQLTYYIPNIYEEPEIMPEDINLSELKTRTGKYSRKIPTSTKEWKEWIDTLALKKREELFQDPHFQKFLKKESSIFHDINLNDILENYNMMKAPKDYYHIPNMQVLLYSNPKYNTNIKEDSNITYINEEFPIYFRYGHYKTIDEKHCPVLIELNFPMNLKNSKYHLKSLIKDGDII